MGIGFPHLCQSGKTTQNPLPGPNPRLLGKPRVAQLVMTTTAEDTGFGLGTGREIPDANVWDIEITSGFGAGARCELTGSQRG